MPHDDAHAPLTEHAFDEVLAGEAFGAAPCRDGATGMLGPLSPADAAPVLNLPVEVTGPSGGTTQGRVQATAEDGNVYLKGSDGVRHLVCLLEQVTSSGGGVPVNCQPNCNSDFDCCPDDFCG